MKRLSMCLDWVSRHPVGTGLAILAVISLGISGWIMTADIGSGQTQVSLAPIEPRAPMVTWDPSWSEAMAGSTKERIVASVSSDEMGSFRVMLPPLPRRSGKKER